MSKKITLDDVNELNEALSCKDAYPELKGKVLQVEALSYRYTRRGEPWLYRHNKTGEVMECHGTDSDGIFGTIYGTKKFESWDREDYELIALEWDNRPEFKDDRRGAMDLISFDMEKLKFWK